MLDASIRARAIEFIRALEVAHGEVLPWRALLRGFEFEGARVPLVSQQGIFKPAVLDQVPLTIRTTPPKPGREPPYHDEVDDNGFIYYAYRGTDPAHRENAGLRLAMERRAPLIYLYGVAPGAYIAAAPVFVVGDVPSALRFTIQVGEALELPERAGEAAASAAADLKRAYRTRTVTQRLHQRGFRHRVLAAYRRQCAVCQLKREPLLDAAHIIPDSDPRSRPVVSNGLAMCSLHHRAYDAELLGVRPDLVVEINADLLDETDGPTLQHALKEMHGVRLHVPRARAHRPDSGALEERYSKFQAAG